MSTRHVNEMQIAVRASRSMLDALDALVPGVHSSRADAVRAAIEQYLYRLACEKDAERYAAAPLSAQELATSDDPTGWESTPNW